LSVVRLARRLSSCARAPGVGNARPALMMPRFSNAFLLLFFMGLALLVQI